MKMHGLKGPFGTIWGNKVSALAPAPDPHQKKESPCLNFIYHMNIICIKFHYYVKIFIKSYDLLIKSCN